MRVTSECWGSLSWKAVSTQKPWCSFSFTTIFPPACALILTRESLHLELDTIIFKGKNLNGYKSKGWGRRKGPQFHGAGVAPPPQWRDTPDYWGSFQANGSPTPRLHTRSVFIPTQSTKSTLHINSQNHLHSAVELVNYLQSKSVCPLLSL